MGGVASTAAAAAPKPTLRLVALGDPVTDVVLACDAGALKAAGVEPGSCTLARRGSGHRRLPPVG